MKPIIPLSLLSLALAVSSASADEKPPVDPKPLDPSFLRLYAETRGFMLGRPTKPKPTPDGKAVLFLRSEPKKPRLSLFEFDVASGKTKELLTPETVLKGAAENLSPEEKARRERMRISVGGFADYQLSEDGTRILLSLSGKLFIFDRDNGKVSELSTGKGTLLDPKFSPDGTKVGYVLNEDVYVYDLASNKETQVTKGGASKVTHGLAEFVAQEEMNRFSGYWWSPDSKFIAYEEADHDGVEVWYVADPAKPDREPSHQYYPRPGKKNVAVRLGIIPIAGGQTVWVDWDHKAFEYLAAVRWDKHGPLTIQVIDRKQQELLLLLADPKTGKTEKLLSETDTAFVNIPHSMPLWVSDSAFMWVSEQIGGPTLGLYNKDGKLMRHYVMGGFRSLISLNDEKTEIIYTAGSDPRSSFVFSQRITLGEKDPETEFPPILHFVRDEQIGSVRSVVASKNHKTTVLVCSDENHMPSYLVSGRDGKGASGLPSVAIEPAFSIPTEFDQVGQGQFYTALLRPKNFDPKKKYPVIVDVYGGPHHLSVTKEMRPWLLMQWLADQGFIVVAIDNRGTPGRGRDWERAIYQKFDSVPLEDQIAGLKALGAEHPEMDLDRVGIVGWSFGGYMSALAVLKRPDVFKAAVAGAPVTDWEDYDTCYTERYLGLLPESQKAYDDANLVKMADKLERPLLLVHGTADDNVYFRHTLKLTDALFRAGKEFEVLPLPSLTHMVPDPMATERLWARIAGHFEKHLGKPK